MNLKNRLSIRAVSLGDDIRQIAPLARSMDYHGLQLDMTIGQLALPDLSQSGGREVRHIVAGCNLKLESIRGTLPSEVLMNAAQHDRVLWMLKRALETTTAMSAGICCVDVGRLPGVRRETAPAATPSSGPSLIIIPERTAPVETEPPVPEKELAAWDGIDSIMQEIGAIADRTGIVLALSSELSSFASLARLLEGARCPWFGVDLDPVSVLRDGWDIEHILDAIGDSLRHVRGRDGIRGSGGRTQPATVGEGTTDWAQMLAMLDSGAYAGWIAIDTVDLTNRAAGAQAAIAHLAPKPD